MSAASSGFGLFLLAVIVGQIGAYRRNRLFLVVGFILGMISVVVMLGNVPITGPVPPILGAVVAAFQVWRLAALHPVSTLVPGEPLHVCTGGCGKLIYGEAVKMCGPCEQKHRYPLVDLEESYPLVRWP